MPSTPDIRVPAPRQPGPQHTPWCDPGQHVDDICYSASTIVGDMDVRLTWQPGGDVMADVSTRDVVELVTLDELEQRALAILTTTLIGRGLTPPASVAAAVTS